MSCSLFRGLDLEPFWPGRQPDAFDTLCPGAAPSGAPAQPFP
jgi:hypothetical protein